MPGRVPRRHPTVPDARKLAREAYDIADAYRNGKIPDDPRGWDATWAAMRRELARRCPGLGDSEYDHALNDGFTSSR